MNMIMVSVREACRPKVCGDFKDQIASLFPAAFGNSTEKQFVS